ncbi:MAG TPA: M23 family metallopeptidase [bacterium]|nr:M23 family metallopeptidase [bacterium]
MPLFAVILLLFLFSCDDAAVSKKPDPLVFISIERNEGIQQTTLYLDSGAVNRVFATVDASFALHADDLAAVSEAVAALDLEKECTEPTGDTDTPLLTYRRGTVTTTCVVRSLKAALDSLLLIPERTMLWPFRPQNEPHPIGHTILSFQDYSPLSGDEYFHPGVDILMPENSVVYNILPGRVVKYDYYDLSGGEAQDRMYFEVVVETQNGLTIQYHHIDPDSVSDTVKDAKQSGEVLPAGAEIGHIVSWPVVETGYSNEPFHHLHLNIFTRDLLPLNGLQMLIAHPDTIPPVIESVTLVNGAVSAVLDPAALTADFHVIFEGYDMLDDNVWPLPPRRYTVTVKDGKGKSLLERNSYDYLAALSTKKEDFACDYYLCGAAGMSTKGDYGPRAMFVNVTAFDEAGAAGAPIAANELGNGERTLTLTACDEYDNCATKKLGMVIP